MARKHARTKINTCSIPAYVPPGRALANTQFVHTRTRMWNTITLANNYLSKCICTGLKHQGGVNRVIRLISFMDLVCY